MNYGDIKNTILLTLDLPLGMTGDVSDLIDYKIQEISNEIIGDLKPKEILVKAGPVAVTNSDDEIPLNVGGFAVTDMVAPYGVTVGTYSGYATTRDEVFMPYISYEAWVQLNSYKLGQDRPKNCFTIDLDSNIIIGSFPEGANSWDVYLWYYKEISAYSSSATPEIPIYYRSVITTGVILEFPQYFKTAERLAMYSQIRSRYDGLKLKLHTLKGHGKGFQGIKSRTSMSISKNSIWPRSPLTS
jgi:hypothetical protein